MGGRDLAIEEVDAIIERDLMEQSIFVLMYASLVSMTRMVPVLGCFEGGGK